MLPSRVLVVCKALGRAFDSTLTLTWSGTRSLGFVNNKSWGRFVLELRLTETDERACTRKDAAQGQGAPLPIL